MISAHNSSSRRDPLAMHCVTERRACSVSPRIEDGLTNATIANGEGKSVVHLALPRGGQEYEKHQTQMNTFLAGSHQSITEASTALAEKESLGTQAIDITLLRRVDGLELTYQQVYVLPEVSFIHVLTKITIRKDVITILRCHHMEYCVQMSQSQWLDKPLRNNKIFAEIDKKPFLEGIKSRLHALSRVQKLTLNHLKSQLESDKYSSAERSLICQLLVDLETSFSAFTSDIGTKYRQGNSVFAARERDLAAFLCESGDYNGALTLLHRIPLAQIGKTDLNRIMQLGVALCSRMRMIPKVLGIDDDPIILDVLESLDVLILPYGFLIIHSCQ